jgi:hypothetical protein
VERREEEENGNGVWRTMDNHTDGESETPQSLCCPVFDSKASGLTVAINDH